MPDTHYLTISSRPQGRSQGGGHRGQSVTGFRGGHPVSVEQRSLSEAGRSPMTLLFQRRCRMTDCSRLNVVRCHQGQMPPDASRQMPPGARCRQMPVARCLPPGPGGGLGEVSRAPVLMSFVLISGDVLPSSVLGSHWLRRWVTCSRRQVWGPTTVDVPRLTVLFHAFLSPTRCPDFHHLRPLGHRPRRLRSANRRFRPWRPAAAATAAVAAGWTSFRSS